MEQSRTDMAREILYLGVLAALAALSAWYLSILESSLHEEVAQDNQTPSLYVDNFSTTRMGVHGYREYTLSAPHLMQLPEQQGTWFEQPDMDIFRDQVLTWLIRAERGWMSDDNTLIRLEGAVSVTRPAASGSQPVVINTRNLLVRPKEEYAETADAVRMETPGGVVTAVGLKARLNEQQLELLSDVRGRYEPPKP